MTNWIDRERASYMRTFNRLPVTLVRGQGSRVWDEDGKVYLDFVGGIAVNALGHCHPVVVEAVSRQVRTLIHTSNLVHTIPQLELAELLIQNSCCDRVFFTNSGSEAVETAIKLARKYGLRQRRGHQIVVAEGGFHGRTMGALSATANPHYQEYFLPMLDGFVVVPYNDLRSLGDTVTGKTCAVLLELVQGEGGVWPADPSYVRGVRELCDREGLLFIVDEVQTGLGRTGTLFAYQQYGVEPDVMTLAKPMAGGLPIGACLAKEHASVFEPGDHGSTFAGNPLVCAVGKAVVQYILEEDLPRRAAEMGARLQEGLRAISQRHPELISDVRGRGLLVAFDLRDGMADRLVGACLENGLLVNKVRPQTIRLAPALTVSSEEVDEGLALIEKSLLQVAEAG